MKMLKNGEDLGKVSEKHEKAPYFGDIFT